MTGTAKYCEIGVVVMATWIAPWNDVMFFQGTGFC